MYKSHSTSFIFAFLFLFMTIQDVCALPTNYMWGNTSNETAVAATSYVYPIPILPTTIAVNLSQGVQAPIDVKAIHQNLEVTKVDLEFIHENLEFIHVGLEATDVEDMLLALEFIDLALEFIDLALEFIELGFGVQKNITKSSGVVFSTTPTTLPVLTSKILNSATCLEGDELFTSSPQLTMTSTTTVQLTTVRLTTVTSTMKTSSSPSVAISTTTALGTATSFILGKSSSAAAISVTSAQDTVTSAEATTVLISSQSSSQFESSSLSGEVFAQSSTTSTWTSSTSSTSLASAAVTLAGTSESDPGLSAPTTSAAAAVPSVGTSGQSYAFNAGSSTNVAVYYGQTAATNSTTLADLCADPNIDIVNLAFVTNVTYDDSAYPSLNFGAACGGLTADMQQEAPGLLNCPQLAEYIGICQLKYGKKVLLSIGGETSPIQFSSKDEAVLFANVLWQVFGPPGSIDIGLRPFGNATIDGFDFDDENYQPENLGTVGSTLRENYAAAPQKEFYLSSAPQCPFPDASIPMDLITQCDFVWVQFYNNPSCQIGSSGFEARLQQWSKAIAATSANTKMFLGAPAFLAAGPGAYVAIGGPQGMIGVAEQLNSLKLTNSGGIMFWDGAEGLLNTEAGRNIIDYAKAGLNS